MCCLHDEKIRRSEWCSIQICIREIGDKFWEAYNKKHLYTSGENQANNCWIYKFLLSSL